MNDQPTVFKPSRDYFKLIVVVCLVLLTAAVGWLVYRVEFKPDKQVPAAVQETEDKSPANDSANTGWNTVVKSGDNGFQVTLPDGWGPIANDIQSDYLVMTGTTQPTVAKGNKVVVTEVKGHGGDSPSLFSIALLDKGGAASLQGTAEEFVIGKGEDEIKGTKYTHIYPKDDLVGIGKLRLQGDRDYEYKLPFGDKELRIYYSVYGSDPHNLVETVDQIVRTVTLAKVSPATR